MLQSLIRLLALSLSWAMTIAPATVAQERQNPLTNQDVIDMVQSGLQESTVVGAIRANSTSFDVSAAALIKLKKAGASQRIMDTMLAAESNKHNPAAVPSVCTRTSARLRPKALSMRERTGLSSGWPTPSRAWTAAGSEVVSREPGRALRCTTGPGASGEDTATSAGTPVTSPVATQRRTAERTREAIASTYSAAPAAPAVSGA